MKIVQMKLAGAMLAGAGILVVGLGTSDAKAQAPNCVASVTGVVKSLKLNPKMVLPRDIIVACVRAGQRPAMASRNVLSSFVAKARLKPGAPKPANCVQAAVFATATAGMPAAAAPVPAIAAGCKRQLNRSALVARNFANGFVVKNKAAMAKPAPAAVAKSCGGRLNGAMQGLRIPAAFASKNNIVAACKRAKGRPVVAMRNMLTRFCPVNLAIVTGTAGLPAKVASPANLGKACANAKGRPALAASNFLGAMVKKLKINNGKPAPAAVAKSCVGRLTGVTRTLALNPKFANAKDIATSCKLAKGKPVLAASRFTARFVKVHKIK